MKVSSKQVVDGLFLVAFIGLGMGCLGCLHKRRFAVTVITQLQERAESERKEKTISERLFI